MYTFFQINRKPKVGTVCQNPTSRLSSVVIGFDVDKGNDVVVIINERGRTQKIEYDHFCDRYCYRGESTQPVADLFNVTKTSSSFYKEDFEVGDVVATHFSLLAVITNVFEKETRKGFETFATLVNDHGTHWTCKLSSVKKKFEYVGRSKVKLAYLMNLRKETSDGVYDILKKERRK